MAHVNEGLLREAYSLFAKGNLDGFYKLCVPDITFTVPGNTRYPDGTRVGRHFFKRLDR